MRAAAQQPNPGVTGQVSSFSQIDLALGEQRVDILSGRVDLVHTRPSRGHHILSVILIGGQAHRGGLDAKGYVLADQGNSLAFSGEIGGTTQDPGVVTVGPETGGQHGGVRVVEFDVQRTALCPNRNGLIQTSVLQPKVIEQPQRLTGEPSQLVMVAFGLHFADHHQRNHHLVLGKPAARPWVREQHRGVDHVGPDIGH